MVRRFPNVVLQHLLRDQYDLRVADLRWVTQTIHFDQQALIYLLLGNERGRLYDVSYMNLTDHLEETLQYYALATFGLTTCTYFIFFSISHLKFFIHRKFNKKEAEYSEPNKV